MKYKVQDESFDGRIVSGSGGRYTIKINDTEHALEILGMDSRGMEFMLDQVYHKARYMEHSTSKIELVIDNVQVTLGANTHYDGIVYKNSGGSGAGSAQIALKSQIPGKVVSVAVSDGDAVKKGDLVCTLESMKMQVAVKAHKDGTIKSIKVKEGATVAKGDGIAEIH